MKVLIVDFAGMSTGKLKAFEYEHGQIVQVENPMDLVNKFFQSDMAVAIHKCFDREWDSIIMVDSHKSAFKQR